MDLRNLERRFFPFLEIDFIFDDQNTIQVVGVDLDGVNASGLSADVKAGYATIARDMNDQTVLWSIDQIQGEFGPFGAKTLSVPTLRPSGSVRNGTPPDSWTAIRLLPENKPVTIRVTRTGGDGVARQVTLTQKRAAYLDENGAFASIFEPGELAQSLCSPWTHDFRDCACFYWASNHPDIVMPAAPDPQPQDQRWRLAVPWERSDRGTLDNPSAPASARGDEAREMRYYEINQRWQELDIATEGREIRRPYNANKISANPLPSPEQLELTLRYAAGVERAAIQSYLTAAFSLNLSPANIGTLRADVATAFAELMRIAISEMRHLRIANDVLRTLNERLDRGTSFRPALQVASEFPTAGGQPEPVSEQRLTPEVLDQFIAIEKPSDSIDGMYAQVMVTLGNLGFADLAQTIGSVMADGFEHFETFLDVKEWLTRHRPEDYLLNLRQPNSGDQPHLRLQDLLLQLLQTLRQGYAAGLPQGAGNIAQARDLMLAGGLLGSCERLRSNGILVVFEPITNDPDFGVVPRPASRGSV
jgi:hypothetical protein